MSMVTLTTRVGLRKSDLRETNERLILNIIRQNPDISRSDIARITDFSPSSVTLIVNRLMRDELVEEVRKEGPAQAGRPPVALRMRPGAMVAIGAEISIHGTKIATADANGHILSRRSVAWHTNPDVHLGRVRDAIHALADVTPARRLAGVGVSIPGTVDPSTGQVIAAENLGWFNVEAGRILGRDFPGSFYLENDAKLAALAECWFCRPGTSPMRNFVFVATRGGLGTGIVIDGQILQGADGMASEFGHTMLYPDGRQCLCGNRGCWEEYASARALERLYAEQTAQDNAKARISAEEIVRLARHGDRLAMEALQTTAAHVALGFINVIHALNPEAIVVGNYLATAWDLIHGTVWEILRARIAPHYRQRTRLQIIPAHHKEDSALRGALALVLSRFFTTFDNGRAPSVSMQATG